MNTRMNCPPRAAILAALLAGALTSTPAHAGDPTTADCLAASEASFKFGNAHALRAERHELLVCSASSCPADIRNECMRRVDEVNRAIPTLIFEAKDQNGQDLTAVKVTMDGETLAERLEGIALSVDPGEHSFAFETPGQPIVEKKFVILEAQKERRESIAFGAPRAARAEIAPEPHPAAPEHGLGTQKTAALIVGGVGVASVAVGTIFGLQALSKHDKAENLHCSGTTCPTGEGVNASNEARTAGNISTVAFIVGGVGLAGGAALWFTAKPSRSTSAQLGVGVGSIHVRGEW